MVWHGVLQLFFSFPHSVVFFSSLPYFCSILNFTCHVVLMHIANVNVNVNEYDDKKNRKRVYNQVNYTPWQNKTI